jgi:hypothetical protein
VKPVAIHDLRLLTQQYQQETRILRTQLNRTNIDINSKTSVINKTFEQSGNRPNASKTIHDHTIHNLNRNIEGTRNTFQTIREQIIELERDDRSSVVEELEEDLKMIFCEYRRRALILQERQSDSRFYAAEQERKRYRASPEHLADLRADIAEIREENAVLRSKARSYLLKLEKLRIEDEVAEKLRNHVSPQTVVEEAEAYYVKQQRVLDRLTAALDREMDEFQQSVGELNALNEDMRETIRTFLDEQEKQTAASSR